VCPNIAAQRIGICDGRILAFRHACTDVNFYFIVEDNICRLIINVKPRLKPIKDLQAIVLPSSPAIANTFVVLNPCRDSQQREKMSTCLRLSNLLSLY
jgi:hypothetical protein